MSFSLTSPVTGAAVTGFTTPTYTVVVDTPPNANSKQYAVSALGGTQTGATVNAVSKPFTVTMFRPPVLRTVPQANVTTGVIKDIPVNSYQLTTRKGALPAANQVPVVCKIRTYIDVYAGTDSFEPAEVKAMLSLHAGAIAQVSAGISDTIITGVL
jgi:hypothetical protein